jgi:VWFA-related protein
VLIVDDLDISPVREKAVRDAVDRFVSDGLHDADDLLLLTSSGDVRWNARRPEAREDVRALAARIRGRKLSEAASDFMSDWEAYQISRTESATGAALESRGAAADMDFGAAVAAPSTSIAERVVKRWMERRFCDPDVIPTPRGDVRPGLPVCRSQVVRRAHAIDQARAERTRRVLARIEEAVFALSPYPGRKSLLLLTEGFLNDPDLESLQLVSARCREASIALYSLDVRGLGQDADELGSASSPGVPDAAEMSLIRQERQYGESGGNVALAESTGGFAVRDDNDLGSAVVRVADESRVYYLLGIVPPPGKGPLDWRALQVKTRLDGVTVRARKGYTLRSTAEVDRAERELRVEANRRGGGAADPPPIEVSRALASGLDRTEIPLQTAAFTFGAQPGGLVRTLVALEADLSRIANLGPEEHPVTVLSLSVAVTHRDTGEVQRLDQQVRVDAGFGGAELEGWLMLSREFALRPGINQARIVLRDEFLGRTGAVTLRFEVPEPRGLRLSTPVLTDRLVRARAGTAAQPAPLVRRTFGVRATLYCQYEVFGAGTPAGGQPPRAQVSYELLDGNGASIRREGPRGLDADRDGRLVALLRIPLDGPLGERALVLRVEDPATGAVTERRELFRLVGS